MVQPGPARGRRDGVRRSSAEKLITIIARFTAA
jgi:hypothetical protein